MQISLQWLKKYIDIDEKIDDLINGLTMIGQEVEAVEYQGKNLDNVVVGKVVEKGQHPNADKLSLCKVDIGEDENLQIICGAPNHKTGDKVAVAKVGAILPGDFKIKKSKIRGELSVGMMCSEKELGIGEDESGIIILDKNAPIGKPLKEYLELDDIVFELEITPNRPDCLSHIGITREIAAYFNKDFLYPKSIFEESNEKTSDNIKINIENPELCSRYAARIIKGVTIGDSPDWLKKHLLAIGLRPINNIVDITNFVLMEFGHPLHAFDYSKIAGKEIIVRESKQNEKMITLDSKERKLDQGTLLITDKERPIAIAGVMGGENSEVDNETKDILLEVATFNPDSIRKTSKKLGLMSDASYRFERGIDVEDTIQVIDRAADLIKEIAGGKILSGIVDKYPNKKEKKEIYVKLPKLYTFLGKIIEKSTIEDILLNLGMEVDFLEEDVVKIVPPSYRGDIEIAADIYEEIARMYGFENIEAVMPDEKITQGAVSANIKNSYLAKKTLSELGLQEVINYSFIPENKSTDNLIGKTEVVKILNPINEDMVVMRPNLMYSLLKNVKDNLNRKIDDINIFEVSKVFEKSDKELPNEELNVAIALCGNDNRDLWNSKPKKYDFFDLKGYIESFFEIVGLKNYKIERSSNQLFHPGRSADVFYKKHLLGTFGEIHIDVLEMVDIKEKVYYAEFDLNELIGKSDNQIVYKPLTKYPPVERDLAIVLDKDQLVGDIISTIKAIDNTVEKVDIFDVYESDQLEKDKKSVALNIVFRGENRTLEEKEINNLMEKILKKIKDDFGGELRS